MALKTLDRREHAALSTCRTLNPYVAAALLDWKQKHSLAPVVPRQLGPAVDQRVSSLAGTSSFGMGGTNAHLMVGVPETLSVVVAAPAVWQRAR
jgi:acyl transferase domain-containing protein